MTCSRNEPSLPRQRARKARPFLMRLVGDRNAGIAGGEQGDQLAPAHGDVGVAAVGRVAPGAEAVAFLGGEDEFDGLVEGGGELRVVDHAVAFGEGEGGKAVVVHARTDIAVGGILLGEDVVEALADVAAYGPWFGSSPWARNATTARPPTAGSEPIESCQNPCSFWLGGKEPQAALIHGLDLARDRVGLATRQVLGRGRNGPGNAGQRGTPQTSGRRRTCADSC